MSDSPESRAVDDPGARGAAEPVRDALRALVGGRELDAAEVEGAIGSMLDGQAGEAEIAALLTAFAIRKESPGELAGVVAAMRAREVRVAVPAQAGPIVDTCGTGGDRLAMFNVSTAAALVAAAAGVRVAKHGNRAASGSVGTADVLEAAGVTIDVGPADAADALVRVGFCFLFAPRYHPSLKALAPVRRRLGFPTVFNLAGPLCNPARPSRQVLGVWELARARVAAETLRRLGTEHALVVHGGDGADELTPVADATAIEVRGDDVRETTIDARDFGIERCAPDDLRGADAATNARVLREVLGGRRGPLSDATALNAGAALYVGGRCASLAEGVALAQQVLAAGEALARLDAYVAFGKERRT